mgnify:FL=1
MFEHHIRETPHPAASGDPPGYQRAPGWRLPWQLVLLIVCALAALLVRREVLTSHWQASALSAHVATLRHHVAPGPAERILFPAHGPFDERMGYAGIPGFTARL